MRLSAIAALGWLACGSALAQEASALAAVWTDPLSRFSIDFAANGFTPPAQRTDAAATLEVESQALQRNANAARTCTVREERLARTYAVDQGEANARLYARTEQDLATAARGRISNFNRARVDGVSVLSFQLATDSGQHVGRLFMLAQNGGVYQVAVTCGGTAPLTLLEVTTMNQTLESLRFLPGAQ